MATESSYYYSKSGASQRKSRNNQQSKSKLKSECSGSECFVSEVKILNGSEVGTNIDNGTKIENGTKSSSRLLSS